MLDRMLPEGTAGCVDHIGIAVRDLDEGIALWRDLLGLELERTEDVPQENVRVAFLKLDTAGSVGHIELLAPMSDEGNIARYIAKNGPGLHHVAVAAGDEIHFHICAGGDRYYDATQFAVNICDAAQGPMWSASAGYSDEQGHGKHERRRHDAENHED